MNIKIKLNTGRDDAVLQFLGCIPKNHCARCANELAKMGYLFCQRQPIDFSPVEKYSELREMDSFDRDSLLVHLSLPAPIEQLLGNAQITDRAEIIRRLISLGFLVFERQDISTPILPDTPSSRVDSSVQFDEDNIVDFFSVEP